MATNVRKPDLNIGDIKALIGALATGERKVLAMVRKFGKGAFLEGVARSSTMRKRRLATSYAPCLTVSGSSRTTPTKIPSRPIPVGSS